VNRIRNGIWTIGVCAAVALPLLAAEKLAAKVGLWETTTTMSMGGMTMPQVAALPPEVIANLPPAQRAQLRLATKSASWQPVTTRSCITEEDLAEGTFREQSQQDMKCTFNVVSSKTKRQESTFQCSSPTGPTDGRLTVDVIDAGLLKGTMQMKGQQMSIETRFDAKWVGADCGATK
jgi:hypothetical protein